MSRNAGQVGYGAKWPSEKPVGVIVALVIAVVSTGAILYYQYERQWPFVERLYAPTYVATGFIRNFRPVGYYALPVVVGRKFGPRLATDGEVVPVVLSNGHPGLALTDQAVKHGAVGLKWEEGRYQNEYLHEMIRQWVFQDQTWWELAKPACLGGLGVFALGLCVGIPRDARATEERRKGRLVRGPLVVTRDQFNRKRTGQGRTDGIGFMTTERQSLRERLLVQYHYGPTVRIPSVDETRHHLFMGTTASGKTTAIKASADPGLATTGETAIIHDPTLEYVRSFYDPGRGDIILNPLGRPRTILESGRRSAG